MEVSNFAFGGPEHRFSHSRLPMSLVLPALFPFSLLADTGKASSSTLDSMDDKLSPVAWSYELSKLLDELSGLLWSPWSKLANASEMLSLLSLLSLSLAVLNDCLRMLAGSAGAPPTGKGTSVYGVVSRIA